MEGAETVRSSLVGLFRGLTTDTKTLIRQEIQLAKTEISEKVSRMGKNSAILAVGGAVAYAGLIVLLIGLGWLLAWAFEKAGLESGLAAFVGLAAIGLIVAGIGGALVLKSLKTMSQESLAPERTIHTLQELKGPSPTTQIIHPQSKSKTESAPVSSQEMQARVEATEDRIGDTLDELGTRLSPQHINAQVKHRIQERPYQAGLLAMGAGIISGLILRRRFRHA